MKLLNLAGRVCCAFNERNSDQMRTVQKVKERQTRDVVTELDMRLHFVSEEFVTERIPGCRLLSEEGGHERFNMQQLLDGEWLIVDPLDGSSNHALGLPHYGYMAAYVRNAHIVGVVIVLPEHNQYIVLDGGRCLFAQPIPSSVVADNGPVYYAYPPRQDTLACHARGALQDLIDTQSAGLYRYGSACVGLYQLLRGKHMAFIGHDVRLWDAVAYLPVLALQQIEVRYRIKGLSITLLASAHGDFLDGAEQILKQQQGMTLHRYSSQEALRIDEQ